MAVGTVFNAPSGPPSASAAPPEPPGEPHLSARERAILSAAARGLTTPEISQALVISPHTVKFHPGNVYRKLG